MKRIVCLIVCFILILGSTTTVSARGKECSHDYNAKYNGDNFVCDICSQCGYENVHKSISNQVFVTRTDNAVSRSGPRKTAKIVNRYAKSGCEIIVVGRIRNEYNHLWLELSDGSFIYADNVAYDFSYITKEAVASVEWGLKYTCNLGFSTKGGLFAVCGPTAASTLASMFSHFSPWTVMPYNLKVDGLLGNTYDYYVFLDGNVLENRYRGEQLGNILYGYVCMKEGFSFKDAVRYAGFAESEGYANMISCVFWSELEKCDDPEDIDMIQLGWNYADSNKWG